MFKKVFIPIVVLTVLSCTTTDSAVEGSSANNSITAGTAGTVKSGPLSSEKIADLCRTEYHAVTFRNTSGKFEKAGDRLDSRIASINSAVVHNYLEKVDIAIIGVYNVNGRVFVFR